MVDTKTIIIIVLLAFMFFWYNNPEKAVDYLDMGIVKTQGLIGDYKCPTTYDPVCGDNNVSYDNSCLAQRAGQNNMTAGLCP